HVRHRADEFVVRILFFHCLKFIQECGVFRTAIRVKEVQLVREFVVCGLQNDASKRSDTNASDEEHRGTRSVAMKRKGTERSGDGDFTAKMECFDCPFESCTPHS